MVVYYCISLLHWLQLGLQSYIFLSMSFPRRLNRRSPLNHLRNEAIATSSPFSYPSHLRIFSSSFLAILPSGPRRRVAASRLIFVLFRLFLRPTKRRHPFYEKRGTSEIRTADPWRRVADNPTRPRRPLLLIF